MAKELFEDIKTGKKEFLFCWESSSANEKLKDFLQNSSIIDIEVDKIKLDSGFVINIEPNDYFRKMTDNKIELWKPKDMIKKFSYIGDTLIEEKSIFHVQDEEFRKKIYEKNPDITEKGYAHIEHIWLDFKYKIEKECPDFIKHIQKLLINQKTIRVNQLNFIQSLKTLFVNLKMSIILVLLNSFGKSLKEELILKKMIVDMM